MAKPSPGLSLSARMLLLVGVLGGGGALGLGVWAFHAAEARVVDEEVRRADAVGAELAARVDAAGHEAFAGLYPEPDSVWSWTAHGSKLAAEHQDLVDTATRHGFASARTLRPVDAMTEAVRAGPTERQRTAMEVILSTEPTPHWRARADYQPEMREAFRRGKTGFRLVRSEKRGDRVETWVPLRDRFGTTLAVLELTTTVTEPLAEARREAGIVAGAGGFAVSVLLLAAALAIRPFEESRAAVLKGLRRLAKNGLEGRFKHGGDLLLWQLESTRAALAGKMTSAEGRAEGAEAQARSVEALLDGRAAERRRILSELVSAGALVIDAGGSRREQADLVDLSFNHVVLRVQKYTMIDLAPGMAASVGWVEGGEPEIELSVAHRTELDDGWEYVFSLEQGATLPGTPDAVAAVAFARGAERVSAEFTEVSAQLMAGLGGVLPARVTDLSADGLGLVLPVRPIALGATGTHATLMLQLRVADEELQFGVIIRSVAANEEGCRVGLQFDPELTSDFDARRAKVAGWVTERQRELALASASSGEYAA